MRIVTARRLSQGFFLVLFVWLAVVSTVGDRLWQLRGWPVGFFFTLDPLAALGTVLSTGTFYAPLFWSLAILVPTFFLGRFFCGFVCPLGTVHQLVGWIFRRRAGQDRRVADNRPGPWRDLKHLLLFFLLAAAALGSLQIGILAPLPLFTRGVDLAAMPLADANGGLIYPDPRQVAGAWLIGAVLLAALALNLLRPRFFCRYLCPEGALLALCSRFAPWRVGKSRQGSCGTCHRCEEYCEGGCAPSGEITTGECVLCLNCLDRCPTGRIGFAGRPSAAGEHPLPDLSRRGAVVAVAAGALAVPLWRVGGLAATGRDPSLIRPPGALAEDLFLERCLRCGLCLRVCPSNVIQPALFGAGIQGLWTPALDFRLARAGCQPHCIACGQVCPTAAIRPLTLEERTGTGAFVDRGPIRLGTAFVDRTRCLPWAMGRPCIVCQEVCPVSPKSIFTRPVFETVRGGRFLPVAVEGQAVRLGQPLVLSRNLAGGDYFLRPAEFPDRTPCRIVAATETELTLQHPLAPGDGGRDLDILVRLQQPHVDPTRCIGCGMCQHECPVSGLRAIRVTNENESRSGPGRMLA
jgi:polyferredoxin